MQRDSRRPSRVLGYARVSGREQGRDGTSLEAQQEAIARFCRERDYPEPKLYVEVESASEEKLEKREELQRLRDAASPGDLILVSLVDRWSRDLVFGVDSVRRLVRAGVRWYSIGEGIDASTPEGNDRLGLMSWVADQERRRIRDRTVGRRKALRDKGLYVEGPASFGYRRGSRELRRQLHLEAETTEAALVREAFARCIAGGSVETVREWLEVETGRAWDKKGVHSLLRNRLYVGEVKDSGGHWIAGGHPPLITRETFERAQEAMHGRRLGGRNATQESRTASWLLRGLCTCPCGARMSAAYSRVADYYACARRLRTGTCDTSFRRVDATDAAVDELAKARFGSISRELLSEPSSTHDRPAVDYEARRARVRSSRERAIRLATEGTISDADLRAQLARLDAELAKLELAAGAVRRDAAGQSPEARQALLEDVRGFASTWERLPVSARREAVSLLAESIVLRDSGPHVTWRTPAELASIRADQPLARTCAPTRLVSVEEQGRKKPQKNGKRR